MGSLVRVARRIALAAALILSGAAHSTAEAATITLAWDPSSDPAVAGYRVFVGTGSGVYTQTFDVDRPWFAFSDAAPGRRYYFAVAALTASWLVGVRSREISGLADGPTAAPGSGVSADGATVICLGAADTDCYTAQLTVRTSGTISSVAALPDGRVLFIENGRRLRVAAGTTLLATPALTTAATWINLAGVAIDPAFDTTRVVFVSEIETREDGRRSLNVVRYRELQNTLGERAVVIAAIPLPSSGAAPFAIGPDGRIYVAIPSGAAGEASVSPYGASVLRFEADGSVPKDSRGASPIFGSGYTQPTAIALESTQQRLWLTGVDAQAAEPFTILDLAASDTAEWPRRPLPIRVGAAQRAGAPASPDGLTVAAPESGQAATSLFVLSATGLQRARVGRDQKLKELRDIALAGFGQPVTIAGGYARELYIGVRTSAAGGAASFAIVKLQSQ